MKNLIDPRVIAEFKANPPTNQQLKDFLDIHPDVKASALCKVIGKDSRGYYDWNYRRKQIGTNPSSLDPNLVLLPEYVKGQKYSASDKVVLVKAYGKLENGSKTEFLRKKGLYQSDIQKWSDAMDAAAIEALSHRKVRKDKKSDSEIELEKLRRENTTHEKTISKLAALVVFQKKVSDLLGQPE